MSRWWRGRRHPWRHLSCRLWRRLRADLSKVDEAMHDEGLGCEWWISASDDEKRSEVEARLRKLWQQ